MSVESMGIGVWYLANVERDMKAMMSDADWNELLKNHRIVGFHVKD